MDRTVVCKYLAQDMNVCEDVLLKKVGWLSIKRARKERSFKQNRFMTKWIAEDIPNGVVMVKRKHATLDLCPCCKYNTENNIHVLTCPSQSTVRNRLINELKNAIALIHTNPHILTYLIDGLTNWFDDPYGVEPEQDVTTEFRQITTSQNSLGWYTTLLRLFHKDLLSHQNKHYKEIGSRRTGTAWGKHMAIKLWNLSYQMWAARNECLHDSVTVHEFKGLEVLHSSILTELDKGVRTLPHELYTQHFQHTNDEILNLDIDDKKLGFY